MNHTPANWTQITDEAKIATLTKAHWKIEKNYTLDNLEEDAIQAEARGEINHGGRPPRQPGTPVTPEAAAIFFGKLNTWAAKNRDEKKESWKKSPKKCSFKIGDQPAPPNPEIAQRTEEWLDESIAEANLAAEQESAASQPIFDLGW